MRFLEAFGMDSVHLRDLCEECGQRREAIHDRLVIALYEESNRADRGNETLQSSALQIGETHDGRLLPNTTVVWLRSSRNLG